MRTMFFHTALDESTFLRKCSQDKLWQNFQKAKNNQEELQVYKYKNFPKADLFLSAHCL